MGKTGPLPRTWREQLARNYELQARMLDGTASSPMPGYSVAKRYRAE